MNAAFGEEHPPSNKGSTLQQRPDLQLTGYLVLSADIDTASSNEPMDNWVAVESLMLVDDGEMAVAKALRVAPSMRGRGVAGLIQKFCLDVLRFEHQSVKRVRLTHTENPPLNMLRKYKVVHSKAIVSVVISSDQLEEAIKLLKVRVDNMGALTSYTVLEPSEVLKLFDGTKTARELLPGGLLVQGWLPLTTQRSNLEMLFERRIVWIYSQAHSTNAPLSSPSTNPAGFLSLGNIPKAEEAAYAEKRVVIVLFAINKLNYILSYLIKYILFY
ncbi:probable N-acetyltransferase 16 [Hyperolius riggenbachi]|uniref:probable N-acetyltransferase 16 n=1 Tax=Hyperolius riggenbachi TaxID=752182 RepID=UPI0035A37DD4